MNAPLSNVSMLLRSRAAESPDQTAVRTWRGDAITYAGLEERVGAITRGLAELGVAIGDRASLFARPGIELVAVTHALLRLGAVPVLIDPGMGRAQLLACVERAAPRVLIGVPRAHVGRLLFPSAFRSVEVAVTIGRRVGWPGETLERVEGSRGAEPLLPIQPADALAAILFTSGSTGPAKGVAVTQRVFHAQTRSLAELYALEPGEVDGACFPLFALFDHALGLTTSFPPIDPSRPGSCDPAAVVGALEASGATFSFGSPAIWRRIAPWMRGRGARFSRLTRVTIAGAPVAPRLVAELAGLLAPGGDVHTPYGATEALPVSSISGAELARGPGERSEQGDGTCIGRPVSGVDLRLMAIRDEPIPRFDPALLVDPGEPGEICVSGDVVTEAYTDDAEATALAKIRDGARIWHRMGDIGCVDAEGMLWYLGRKQHRVETEHGVLHPVPFENVYDACAGVRQSAFVGVGPRGAERPYLIVAPEAGVDREALARRLVEHGRRAVLPAPLEGVLFQERLPVDARHNAKIQRGELKRWAERELA